MADTQIGKHIDEASDKTTEAGPKADEDRRYGEDQAGGPGWPQVREHLAEARLYWISTVRPDGRPHVTPLIGVWADGSLFFCTGPQERKALNLAQNQHCVLTTGTNALHEGLDVVLEGDALRVRDGDRLRWVAEGYEAKYGQEWHFDVHQDVFRHPDGAGDDHDAYVFEVAPVTVFGFGKDPYRQTRFRFDGS